MEINLKVKVVLTLVIVGLLVVPASYAITRTITSSTDNIYTRIVCSNGNTYEATFANLQIACNLSGVTEVRVPAVNITFTGTLWIPSNVSLVGVGNGTVFYLGNGVNRTLIRNSHGAAGDKNIRISDIRFEGNSHTQTPWVTNNNRFSHPCGIVFWWCNDTILSGLTFNNIAFANIQYRYGHNQITTNCFFYNWGSMYNETRPGTSGYFAYFAVGIGTQGCDNFTISKCIFNRGYSAAVLIQSAGSSPATNFDEHWTVSDCIASDCHFGYYMEDSKDGVITNCVAINLTRNISTQKPMGLYVSDTSRNIELSNIFVSKCGNQTWKNSDATGIKLSGHNSSLINSKVIKQKGDGITISGYSNMVSHNSILNSSKRGIYSIGVNPSITENIIQSSGTYGININLASGNGVINKYALVSNNIINDTESDGIYCSLYNVTFTGNDINDVGPGFAGAGINIQAMSCIVNNNHITLTTALGISLGKGNNTCIGNILQNIPTEGIRLGTQSKNNTVIGNIMKNCTIGIKEYANYNIVIGNFAYVRCATGIDLLGTKSIAIATGNIPTPV